MSNYRLQKLAEMLEKQPDDTFLLYAMGMEYLGQDEPEKAESMFRKVLEADQGHIAVRYQLAAIFQNTSRENEAIPMLEKGMELARIKGDLKTMNEFRTALDDILF